MPVNVKAPIIAEDSLKFSCLELAAPRTAPGVSARSMARPRRNAQDARVRIRECVNRTTSINDDRVFRDATIAMYQ